MLAGSLQIVRGLLLSQLPVKGLLVLRRTAWLATCVAPRRGVPRTSTCGCAKGFSLTGLTSGRVTELTSLTITCSMQAGFQCPATLSNGNQCRGHVASSQVRHPTGKLKAKAAVDMSTAPALARQRKAPPTPAPAPTAVRSLPQGLRVVRAVDVTESAAARPAAGSGVKALSVSGAAQPGAGAAARLGLGAATNTTNAQDMGPRVIPGWEAETKRTSKGKAVDQQRAVAAVLKAEALAAAGKRSPQPPPSWGATGACAPCCGHIPLWLRQVADLCMFRTGHGVAQAPKRSLLQDDLIYTDDGSEDSDTHPFQRYVNMEREEGSG